MLLLTYLPSAAMPLLPLNLELLFSNAVGILVLLFPGVLAFNSVYCFVISFLVSHLWCNFQQRSLSILYLNPNPP